MMYGWFSTTQAISCGYFVYADVDGNEVKVTETSESSDAWELNSRWEDMVFVGKLRGKEIRRATPTEVKNSQPPAPRLSPEIKNFLAEARRMKEGM